MSTESRSSSECREQLKRIIAELREHDADRERACMELDALLRESERDLSSALDAAFDRRSAAIDWLLEPTIALGQRPINLLATGQRDLLIDELGRIAHGDFA